MPFDLRRPPSEHGFANLGNGLMVPQGMSDAQELALLSEGYGAGERYELGSVQELHDPAALQQAAEEVYEREMPKLRAIVEASKVR